MYLQSELADIDFIFPNAGLIQPERVSAHKNLLASASPVFKAMFFGPLKEADTVEIVDFNASAFKELLQFIYLPEVKLTIGNIEEVVRLADKYDMLECFETCVAFLEANLTTENMAWGYQLAITLNNSKLMGFCEKRIQIFIEKVIKSEMFLHCSRDVIDHIVKLDRLECDEAELFNACVAWAMASCERDGLDVTNPENLKNQLGPCFYSIRFGAMDPENIANLLQSKIVEGLFTKEELAEIVRLTWHKQSRSELFNHHPRLKSSYTWDATNKLAVARVSHSGQPRCYIQQQESTWFSSNDLILLGEIAFTSVQIDQHYDYRIVALHFDIEIIEHGADNFAPDVSTKQLYMNSNVRNSTTLLLATPIAIRPHKMYEIRLHPKSGVGSYVHFCTWVPEVKLDERITIKFHQNPAENSSARRGLVSILYFNRIE